MRYDELHALLDKAIENNDRGNFDLADDLSRKVIAELESSNNIIEQVSRSEAQTLHCSALITLSRAHCRRGDFDQALVLARTSLDVAEQIASSDIKAQALKNIGDVYWYLSDFSSALTHLQKALDTNEEAGNQTGISSNLCSIGLVYYAVSDHSRALEYLKRSLSIDEDLDNKDGIATNLANIGCVYEGLSDYATALEYYQKALSIEEDRKNKYSIAGILHNIGSVHQNLSENAKAVEYYRSAMVINEETGNRFWLANNLGNLGLAHANLSNFSEALGYLRRSLEINEALGKKDLIANSLANIGFVLYRSGSDYRQALDYMQRSLELYQEIGSRGGIGLNYCNMGIIYAERNFDGYDPVRAERYLREALTISRETGYKKEEFEACKWLSEFYKSEGRWQEAYRFLQESIVLEKEIQTKDARDKAILFEHRRQEEEREKQLVMERSRAQATEELLHKTLPKSIAERVIQGETIIADHFQSASVLFADVVGFTEISSGMSPTATLAFMNFLFEHFDHIALRYGCERIKTIGDGYMAVCGAPERYPDHAERLASMALDMMEDINLPAEIRVHLPIGTHFHLRIGLHCGEITAGLIGTGKLAYDVYGDAVNTASRMESHGEPNRIHVSEEFYSHLQNSIATDEKTMHGFAFEERGKMEIKGKGMMRTYFLERA